MKALQAKALQIKALQIKAPKTKTLESKPQHGFSLIELVIVVAIVGLLVAAAIPSYQSYIAKSHRLEAKSALISFAQQMERHFTENSSYCDAGSDPSSLCGSDAVGDVGAPQYFYQQVPFGAIEPAYQLEITEVTQTSYLLSAIPVVGSVMESDECGTLSYSNLGVTSSNDNYDCW
ncbi:type IV pilin protein [Reinekea thalattae]|uniref:Type IV pilin protein n=1 Tax=Reinekea thalattae TaxID=2593301 RepID=A0A5C8Z2P0_9GAMM|nr:type IV pilin protein [Reinekea thalattae]TXR51518.1 type IV pilin protein [Reinekea thalattae]